jgi:carboxylesterase
MTTAIKPGCESYSAVGGPFGVLVLHGFTGSTATLRSLGERLAGAGFSVELPCLPGHGSNVEDLMATTWTDWSNAALAAYDELAKRCEHVALVGLSMGGALSVLVAESHPEVVACVLVNPVVKPPPHEIIDGLNQLLVAGVETIESIGSDVKKEGVDTLSNDATPLACAKTLFEGLVGVQANLANITMPVLLFSSREDHVVTSDNGDELEAMAVGPLERVWLDDSYHVATMDNDQEFLEHTTLSFLKRVADE